MSASFASQLRAPEKTLQVSSAGAGNRLTIRVQMPEVGDLVRIETPETTSVATIKQAALQQLYPDHVSHAEFLLKLNGFEVLDEGQSIADAGAKDGSTFLLTFRRRRPVR